MIVQITAGGKFDRAFAIDRALVGIVLSDYALESNTSWVFHNRLDVQLKLLDYLSN